VSGIVVLLLMRPDRSACIAVRLVRGREPVLPIPVPLGEPATRHIDDRVPPTVSVRSPVHRDHIRPVLRRRHRPHLRVTHRPVLHPPDTPLLIVMIGTSGNTSGFPETNGTP